MTFREIINQVLIRLREDTIPTNWSGDMNDSVSLSDYHKTIGALVNDSKRYVESHHDWLSLRESFTISTVPGTMQYILGDTSTGAGTGFKVLDVINQNTGRHLDQANNQWLNSQVFPTAPSGSPTHYAFNGSSVVVEGREADVNVDLFPVPISDEDVTFNIVRQQDELKGATDTLMLPALQAVILGAWARAISERGEDGGTQSSLVAQEASESMNQAIMVDNGNTEYEGDWYVG